LKLNFNFNFSGMAQEGRLSSFIPSAIMGFREGMEAFLIMVLILQFLNRAGRTGLVRCALLAALTGIPLSVLLGSLLNWFGNSVGNLGATGKIWESGASLFAVALVVMFILWMIRHGAHLKEEITGEIAKDLRPSAIYLVTLVLIAREGVEIAIFSFAGKFAYSAVLMGVGLAFVLALLAYFSMVRVPLRAVFQITLVYLILQAGYLAGYSLHEGLSALKELALISPESPLLLKLFNLSGGMLDHKSGPLGVALNILLGWHSKPEIMQFFLQYGVTLWLFSKMRRSS
jgi:high-affinity iron transporter